MAHLDPSLTRAGAFWPGLGIALGGAALITLGAKLQVPFWPVPMTLQTLVVLMIGAIYGARLAGVTLLTYLVQGAVGLPVFASGAGLAYLAGPTGGYLAGFLLAAVAVGTAADRGLLRRAIPAFAVLLVATALIYASGVLWLAGFVGMQKAIAAGLLPFLPAEAFKLALAVLLVLSIARRAGR